VSQCHVALLGTSTSVIAQVCIALQNKRRTDTMPPCSATDLREDGRGRTEDREAGFPAAGRHNEVIRVAAVGPSLQVTYHSCHT